MSKCINLKRNVIFTIILILYSINIIYAQLGVKFEAAKGSTLNAVKTTQISDELKAKICDIRYCYKVGGFILPLSDNKYEFEYNWNNNPIMLIESGGFVVDKQGRAYSIDNNRNLVNYRGEVVDFCGIIVDDYYSIRKFCYWIESNPKYIFWYSVIIICLFQILMLFIKKLDIKLNIK